MTFQPPPPPPPPGGTPPPPPPPPPQGGGQPYGAPVPPPPPPGAPVPGAAPQWGVPATGGPGFDPKNVNSFDWALLGIGLLTFIFSFFSYYTASVKFLGQSVSAHENAWHGFFGWFAVFCALAGAVIVAMALFAPQVKLPIANRLAALGLFAIATVCVIIAWFVTPGVSGAPGNVDFGRGFGFYSNLVLIIAGLVICLMRAQQTGTALPGGLNKVPKIGR